MRDRGRGVAVMMEARNVAATTAATTAADQYDNELLTVAQAAEEATVSDHTIRRGYYGGHLRGERVGRGSGAGGIGIRRRALRGWLEAGANTLIPEGRSR